MSLAKDIAKKYRIKLNDINSNFINSDFQKICKDFESLKSSEYVYNTSELKCSGTNLMYKLVQLLEENGFIVEYEEDIESIPGYDYDDETIVNDYGILTVSLPILEDDE